MNYANLSNQQLLSMVIREKEGEGVTKTLFQQFSTLPGLLVEADESELSKIKGVGDARIKQMKAIYELAKRLYTPEQIYKSPISSPQDAAKILIPEMQFLKKEYFKTVLLDTKSKIVSIETISIGTLNSSIVHPREVFNPAIKKCANTILLVHNHPSGNTSPSQEDIMITKRLIEAGKIIGIEVLDHIIIGGKNYISLKERGNI